MSLYLINPEGDNEDQGQSSEQSGRMSPSSNITGIDSSQILKNFWPKHTEEIRKIQNLDPRCQNLPLARIKKIMKLDEEVRMISAEAPVLFAKAAELFILELTLRAWLHTEGNKRRTLQRNDIAMAISKYDQFDFLIDIVPRDEIKPQSSNKSDNKSAANADQVHYYFQLAQQHQAAMQNTAGSSQPATIPIQLIQPTQIQAITVNPHQQLKTQSGSSSPQIVQLQGGGGGAIQLVQQVVTPSGEVQHVPVQLNSNQMQMMRMQVQGGGGSQPLILQTAPSAGTSDTPHVIQVSQSSNSAPVFIQSNGGENE